MEQLILQRLNSIENRLHEINTLQDEGKKWRIILQHWIRKNFDFDVENQMNKPDILAFYYEPPSVGQILGKNIQVLPQLENIIMKQQLEIADYIKKLNSRIVQQSQMVHHNSVPSGSSSSSSRMVPTTIQQQPHNQSLYHHHHHQTQTQKNPNLISQMNKNQSTFSQNEHQPHQTNRQRIQQHHNFVQNQQMLQKQKQQQREIAWLNQISRPTGPGPGSSGPDHVRNISRRNSPQNLGQHSMQHSVQNQRHNNDLSIEEAVGTTRTMQLQRLPVTIEKINVPAPVSLSTSNHQQTSSSSSDRQRISAAPGVVPGMRNSHGVGNRNISSTVSYSSNFQQDDGGRICPGSVQQQQRNNMMTSQNSSVPFAYECQTCQIKFRHKSAAQLHVAKVHSLKQKPSHPAADVLSSTSNSQIHEQTRPAPRTMSVTGDMGDDDNTMPIIMSVAGGGKRYVRKEQTRITSAPISLPVSVPAGLSISINSDLPAPPPPAASNNNNNNSTIFPATTATRNLAAVPGQSRVLDEITISDDEDEADQYNQQNQNSISSSSMATTTTAGPPSAVGDRIPCETRLTYATNDDDDGDEIICDPLAEDSQLQNPRISTAPASNVQQSSSPTSSSPVQKSSTFILSSKLSTLLSGAGSRVGGKRPSDIPSHSGRTSTSSPDKRNRPNENLSSDTIPENLEIAPEINLYTDDDGEYSEFQSPTSAGDATTTADGVVTMNDDELVSPDGLNNNSVGCHDDNEEEAGDDFNDGS